MEQHLLTHEHWKSLGNRMRSVLPSHIQMYLWSCDGKAWIERELPGWWTGRKKGVWLRRLLRNRRCILGIRIVTLSSIPYFDESGFFHSAEWHGLVSETSDVM
ncbi:hypothetical protein TNCV_3755871 [Trichonephila clavipes]|nr:hypothetical protein TNCV_3755871 [Trichonephila clavipes]